MLNYRTLRLISIEKFNRWLITHFCPVILARIDPAGMGWTILTKNKGHISARIYLARVISAFVGWIISTDKHFCPEYSGKASAKIGLNKWRTLFAQNFWPPHSKVSSEVGHSYFNKDTTWKKVPRWAWSLLEYLSQVFPHDNVGEISVWHSIGKKTRSAFPQINGVQTIAKIPPRSAQIIPTSFPTLGARALAAYVKR